MLRVWKGSQVSAFVKIFGPASRRFRRERAERLLDRLPEIRGGRVVDIGGSLPFWKYLLPILQPAEVKIYNITSGRMVYGMTERFENVECHLYDGSSVPLADGEADVVICSSVIEHVPLENRRAVAREIRRLGKRYYVQSPAKAFPLEVHFMMPFIHWLPRPVGRMLARVSPWRFMIGEPVSTDAYFDETRLLSKKEMRALFPDATIETEWFMGMPKSYMAFSEGTEQSGRKPEFATADSGIEIR